jgi:hypothetical protein
LYAPYMIHMWSIYMGSSQTQAIRYAFAKYPIPAESVDLRDNIY